MPDKLRQREVRNVDSWQTKSKSPPWKIKHAPNEKRKECILE